MVCLRDKMKDISMPLLKACLKAALKASKMGIQRV